MANKTRTEAQAIFKVARQSLDGMIAPGGQLADACVKVGKRVLINMDHPAAKAYLAKQDHGAPKLGRITVATAQPAEIREYWDWTLDQIINKCGTMALFASLLTAADKVEGIHAKRLLADKSTGELIPREYVAKHILGLVERVFQRLLSEMPQKLGYAIHGMCQTGASAEDVHEMIKDAIARELKTVKGDTQKEIRNAAT